MIKLPKKINLISKNKDVPFPISDIREKLNNSEKGEIGESLMRSNIKQYLDQNDFEYYDYTGMKNSNSTGADAFMLVRNKEDNNWEILYGDNKDFQNIHLSDYKNMLDRKEEWLTNGFNKIDGLPPELANKDLKEVIQEMIENGRINILATSTDSKMSEDAAKVLEDLGVQYIDIKEPSLEDISSESGMKVDEKKQDPVIELQNFQTENDDYFKENTETKEMSTDNKIETDDKTICNDVKEMQNFQNSVENIDQSSNEIINENINEQIDIPQNIDNNPNI